MAPSMFVDFWILSKYTFMHNYKLISSKLVTWMVLGGLFYSIVYAYEDYKADPTYCITRNGTEYFKDLNCVGEVADHETCIKNVYRKYV